MLDKLEIKIDKESTSRFIEIESIKDWVKALRTLIEQFEEDAPKDFLRGSTIRIVVKGRKPVTVSPVFPTEGGINKVSGVVTYDDSNTSSPLGTLVADKRIKGKSEFIISSLKVEDYKTDENSGENNQIKRHADIAAVEHGISEQAYGGRSAIIATIMTHKYGQLLGEKDMFYAGYHGVYVGTGKGAAGDLAALQNEIQQLKILKQETEQVKTGNLDKPSTIAVQLSQINQDIIRIMIKHNKENEANLQLQDEFRKNLLTDISKEAKNAIQSLYEEDGEETKSGIIDNLTNHLNDVTKVIIENKDTKITQSETARFPTSTGKSTGTEIKILARTRSDAGDDLARAFSRDENMDLDMSEAIISTKVKENNRKRKKEEGDTDPRKKIKNS